MEANNFSIDETSLLHNSNHDSNGNIFYSNHQSNTQQSLFDDGVTNVPVQIEDIQLEKKGRFQLKRPATKKNSSQEMGALVEQEKNNVLSQSADVYTQNNDIFIKNEAQIQQISSQNTSKSGTQQQLSDQMMIDAVVQPPRLSLGLRSSNNASNGRIQEVSSTHSKGKSSNNQNSKFIIHSGENSSTIKNNSISQVNFNQTIIQIQAEILSDIDGGVITLQAANDGDQRAMEIINNGLSQLQNAVEVKGRFRVQEAQLNGFLLNGPYEEIKSQALLNNQNQAQNGNKISNSHDQLEIVKQTRRMDQSPMGRLDQDYRNYQTQQNQRETQSRFEILSLNFNSLQKQHQETIDEMSIARSNSKKSNHVPESPQPRSGTLDNPNLNDTPTSNKQSHRELFLLQSSPKSQTGFIQGLRNKLDDTFDKNFCDIGAESISNNSKSHKYDMNAYRTNRLNSEASQADCEDNYPNASRLIKQYKDAQNKSRDTSDKDNDNENGDSDEEEKQNFDQQKEEHVEYTVDDNNNIDNTYQNGQNDNTFNALQDSGLNKTTKSNDPGNEADVQSEANENENANEQDQTLDHLNFQRVITYIQEARLNEESEQEQIMEESDNQKSNKKQHKHLDDDNYSSEFRSDKSQQDIESPNEDCWDTVHNFNIDQNLRSNINNQHNNFNINSGIISDQAHILFAKQATNANQQKNYELLQFNDNQKNDVLNNSQNYSSQKLEWNYVTIQDQFSNDKIEEYEDYQQKQTELLSQSKSQVMLNKLGIISLMNLQVFKDWQQFFNLMKLRVTLSTLLLTSSNSILQLYYTYKKFAIGQKDNFIRLKQEYQHQQKDVDSTIVTNTQDSNKKSSISNNPKQFLIKKIEKIEENNLISVVNTKKLELMQETKNDGQSRVNDIYLDMIQDQNQQKKSQKQRENFKNDQKNLNSQLQHQTEFTEQEDEEEEEEEEDENEEIEWLLAKFIKIIKNRNSKHNKKRKSDVTQQRGEKQSSLKKLIKLIQEIDDSDQNGKININDSTDHKNKESKGKKSKRKIQLNGMNMNGSLKLKMDQGAQRDEQLSPINLQQYQISQQVLQQKDQIIDESMLMYQPNVDQPNQNLLMMNSFNNQHQSMISFNQIYQAANQDER